MSFRLQILRVFSPVRRQKFFLVLGAVLTIAWWTVPFVPVVQSFSLVEEVRLAVPVNDVAIANTTLATPTTLRDRLADTLLVVDTLDVCGRTKPGISHSPVQRGQMFDQFRLEEILFERWKAYTGPLVGRIVVVPSPIEWCIPKSSDGLWQWGMKYMGWKDGDELKYNIFDSLKKSAATEYWDYLRDRFPPPVIVVVHLSFAWDLPSARTMLHELMLRQPVSFSSRVIIPSIDGNNLLAEDEALMKSLTNPPLMITVPYPVRWPLEYKHGNGCATCDLVPCGYCLQDCRGSQCTYESSVDRVGATSRSWCRNNNAGEFPPACRPAAANSFELPVEQRVSHREIEQKREVLISMEGNFKNEFGLRPTRKHLQKIMHDECGKDCQFICRDGMECKRYAAGQLRIWERSESSVFCLEPPGDTVTRSHLQIAILSGCIPVLFDGEIFPQGRTSHEYVIGDHVSLWCTSEWSGSDCQRSHGARQWRPGLANGKRAKVTRFHSNDMQDMIDVVYKQGTDISEANNIAVTSVHLMESVSSAYTSDKPMLSRQKKHSWPWRHTDATSLNYSEFSIVLQSDTFVSKSFDLIGMLRELAADTPRLQKLQRHLRSVMHLFSWDHNPNGGAFNALEAEIQHRVNTLAISNDATAEYDRVSRWPQCTDVSSHTFRSAFIDHRPRRFLEEDELSVVILAELPKGSEGQSMLECSASVDGTAVNGKVHVEHLQIDSDVGYSWINLNLPWLTHRQSFVHCILDKAEVPANANVAVKLTRQSVDGGKCWELAATATRHIVPGPGSKSIEACVAVFRNDAGFPLDGMLAKWLTHYKTELGVSRISLYVADPGMLAARSEMLTQVGYDALVEAVESNWVHIVPWKPFNDSAKILKATVAGKYIEVGDGRTFYFSQALAYNDCLYQSASRNSRALVVDFDDFVTALPSDASTFDMHNAMSFAWVRHDTTKPLMKREQQHLKFWDQFARNQQDWSKGEFQESSHGPGRGLNGKCLYNSITVLDVEVHTPMHCIIEPCKVKRPNHEKFYAAHVRKG